MPGVEKLPFYIRKIFHLKGYLKKVEERVIQIPGGKCTQKEVVVQRFGI